MDIRWNIVARGCPISLEHLFYDLMAHKDRIEPTTILRKELAQINIIGCNIKPILHLFCSCHTIFINSVGTKLQNKLELHLFFTEIFSKKYYFYYGGCRKFLMEK